MFARQANIAHGPQQVNNGATPRAGEKEIPPNQLLDADHGERLDTSTTSVAGGRNSALASVGKLDRAEDAGGKARSAMRGYKGAIRPKLRALARLMYDEMERLVEGA